MPTITFRKRQRLADIAPHALAKRIIPPFLMGRLPRLFAHAPMRFCRKHGLIRLPKVTVADTLAKRHRDAMPQTAARPLAMIPQDKRQDMLRPAQQDRPQPPFMGPFPHKTPGFIDFQHIVRSRRRQRLSQRGQRLKFFFDPGGQRFPRDAKNSADAAHTRAFLIRPQNFLAAVFAILAFRGQDPNRPTVFTEILLTAAPVMAVFDNVLTAAFSALLRYVCGNHTDRISNSREKEQENIIIIYNTPLPQIFSLRFRKFSKILGFRERS